MGEVVFFPIRENKAAIAFEDFKDYLATTPELADMDMAELIASMRDFTDFCLTSDKNLRKLYKMIYFS